MNKQYGFLRETKEAAEKAGIDIDTGLIRTGLDEYLSAIYPGVDWIHDKIIKDSEGNSIYVDGKVLRNRPDYRSEELKLIVEFDGIPHYTKPDIIIRDINSTEIYEQLGYKVVRIPFFIQLTNKAVKTLFGVDVNMSLFPEGYPSMGPNEQNTPAYMCHLGLERMASDFKRFPEQYETNIKALRDYETKDARNIYLVGSKLLSDIYESLVVVNG